MGRITDSDTLHQLPYVCITYNNNHNGVISDINGQFKITSQKQITQIHCKYIGYKSVVIKISPNHSTPLLISLKKENRNPDRTFFNPEKNPAIPIIIKAIENRDKNNPEKRQSFSYTLSNKLYITIQEDTLQKGDPTNPGNNKILKDSTEKKSFNEQHLFDRDLIIERHFRRPDRNVENILSSKISGINDPVFTLLANQIQPFSFYDDYIPIFDQHFLNPINQENTNQYFYNLEDTVIANLSDTIYIISFQPQNGKKKDALSGFFYINTNAYAIQNIIATPANEDSRFSIALQQQYKLIENTQWFPTELTTTILFKNHPHNQYLKGIGQNYLNNIKLDKDTLNEKFDKEGTAISTELIKRDSTTKFPGHFIPLAKNDSITYHIIDSIENKTIQNQKMLFLEALVYNYLPIGGFNIDYQRIIGINKFEGLKLGLGIATNPKIFKFASIGGFFTYGLRDKNWKYGGFVQLFPKWYSDTKFTVRYAKNVSETGGYKFLDDYVLNATDFFRNYFTKKMDKTREIEIGFSSRAFRSLKYSIYLNRSEKQFNNYQFLSSDWPMGITDNCTFTEIGIQLKFAYGEKFIKTPRGQLVSLGTKYPILWVNLRKGTKILNGDLNYTKYEAKLSKKTITKHLGVNQIQLKAGEVFGDIPISNLYGAHGCYDVFTVDVENNFAAIRPGEFYSQKFIYFFFKQNFGSLLFKDNKFKPEINLVTNMGWGQMSNAWRHQNVLFRTMEKGYLESGVLVTRLINLHFMSLGLGSYYRYGYYRFAKIADNFAYKLSFTFTL
jgi:hypothetical protein